MTVKISQKYQIVIPEKVRKGLNLEPGQMVDVIAKGKVAYIVPIRPLSEIQDLLKNLPLNQNIRDKKDRKV